jgi:hypothetical protein
MGWFSAGVRNQSSRARRYIMGLFDAFKREPRDRELVDMGSSSKTNTPVVEPAKKKPLIHFYHAGKGHRMNDDGYGRSRRLKKTSGRRNKAPIFTFYYAGGDGGGGHSCDGGGGGGASC